MSEPQKLSELLPAVMEDIKRRVEERKKKEVEFTGEDRRKVFNRKET